MDLQTYLQNTRKETAVKKLNNLKLEQDVQYISQRVNVMEENLNKIVFDNHDQFETMQDQISANKENAKYLREELTKVKRQ